MPLFACSRRRDATLMLQRASATPHAAMLALMRLRHMPRASGDVCRRCYRLCLMPRCLCRRCAIIDCRHAYAPLLRFDAMTPALSLLLLLPALLMPPPAGCHAIISAYADAFMLIATPCYCHAAARCHFRCYAFEFAIIFMLVFPLLAMLPRIATRYAARVAAMALQRFAVA